MQMALTAEDIGLSQDEVQSRVVEAIADQIVTTASCDDEGNVHKRRASFVTRMENTVESVIRQRAEKLIDSQLEAVIDKILSSGFQPVDSYGEPKGEKTTLRDMIKKKAEAFLSERVDKNGKTADRYADPVGTRLDVAMQKHVDGVCTATVQNELKTAVEAAKGKIGTMVAKVIVEKLLK
jgi:hypothetical protein